jgi:hypothetical protein
MNDARLERGRECYGTVSDTGSGWRRVTMKKLSHLLASAMSALATLGMATTGAKSSHDQTTTEQISAENPAGIKVSQTAKESIGRHAQWDRNKTTLKPKAIDTKTLKVNQKLDAKTKIKINPSIKANGSFTDGFREKQPDNKPDRFSEIFNDQKGKNRLNAAQVTNPAINAQKQLKLKNVKQQFQLNKPLQQR